MKKFQLDLQGLDVQTFETTGLPTGRAGTVLGHGTVGAYESCAASWCGDCRTDTDPACADGGSSDCDSANPMFCQSGALSDCCPSVNWTDCGCREPTNDPFGGECT